MENYEGLPVRSIRIREPKYYEYVERTFTRRGSKRHRKSTLVKNGRIIPVSVLLFDAYFNPISLEKTVNELILCQLNKNGQPLLRRKQYVEDKDRGDRFRKALFLTLPKIMKDKRENCLRIKKVTNGKVHYNISRNSRIKKINYKDKDYIVGRDAAKYFAEIIGMGANNFSLLEGNGAINHFVLRNKKSFRGMTCLPLIQLYLLKDIVEKKESSY